jgi:hypothetical protein
MEQQEEQGQLLALSDAIRQTRNTEPPAPSGPLQVLNMVKLFGKPLRVNKAAADKNSPDVGANLFIGGLDPEVDEKVRREGFLSFVAVLAQGGMWYMPRG